ncbi:dihydrofolate reductase family protein [Methanosarcina sp.]|uniref:dihydrofolate reductase family protein n=1 Tax=Methanosarcina sp. TaxID=2213 RepID=UPI002ABC391F|nr:dihydrofolate reductase family protein [Methanosarcina sp.]MDY9926918.1 dihydrofolate reductase family protein [Methanosarcina sp.]
MRKIIMFNRISVDGFFAGPNGEIDWFIADHELDKALHEMGEPDMDSPDTVLLGRVTYQLFESFWPKVAADPESPEEARVIANELNQMTKVVFSKTLKEVSWQNTRLVKGNVIGEVSRLKQEKGSDILIFGSGTIVQQLADEGLIDEYLLAVTPVVLGTGKPLFKDVKKLNLKLLETKKFKSGNVLLHYETEKG